MPDGSLAEFRFVESPVMPPELAAEYPDIRTYAGTLVNDPSVTVRFDSTPSGFHAYVRTREGTVAIDPLYRYDATVHAVYFKQDDGSAEDGWQCLTPAPREARFGGGGTRPLQITSGNTLRVYRLACAATGEFTQNHGGTVKAGLAAVVTIVNRLNAIYEPEVAIRFVLVANNDRILYTDGTTDPYTSTDAHALLGENQANLDAIIGDANYDLGHVLSTASGGLATLGVVCYPGYKARAQTGRGNASTDAFYVDYIAHEIGHQFSARHTFNSTAGSCGNDNRDSTTAYEPGSGSTLMSYGGNCTTDNIQSRSDLYFHAASLSQIIGYSTLDTGNSCPLLSPSGNSPPLVSAGPNYAIPQATPFTLTASGSDPDGDALTYCWEELDLGPATSLTSPDNGSSPLFRSVQPTADSSRVFPRLQDILSGAATPKEKLPTTSRTLHFRVTARDNRAGGGGMSSSDMLLTVVGTAGPFALTSHNNGGSLSNTTTITWNIAGTTATPINTSLVNIWLSTNGGQLFNTPLALNTPNDGSEVVTLPVLSTTVARLKVEAVGNVFFDVGDSNFTILPRVPVPIIAIRSTTLVSEGCLPANGAVDAGETVNVNFMLQNNSITKTTNLVATLLAGGGVLSPGPAQTYGAISGGGLVTKPFNFTAGGTCGGSITATLQLQDNALDLGTVSKIFALGGSAINTLNRLNNSVLTIPANGTQGAASLYPSTIAVSGVTGTVTKVRVTLTGLTHAYAGDLDVLLIGPTGQSVMLMSDGGNGTNITNATLTFDNAASTRLFPEGRIVTSTNQPTDYDPDSDVFPAPAPAGPYGQTLAAFTGLNPNGTWSLFINDDSAQDGGSLSLGWRLSITESNLVCCGSAPDNPPTLSNLSDLATDEDTSTTPIPFTIGDAETLADALTVSAASSNTNLVSTASLLFGGSGTSRTLTLKPATNAFGNSTITVTVDDGANSTSDSFVLTVKAVNDPPTIAAVADRTVHAGAQVWITNSANDVETPAQNLTFALASATAAGATVNPASGLFGWQPADANAGTSSTFRVRVSDGGAPTQSATNTFRITTVSRPLLQFITRTNGVVTLKWTAIAGLSYRVQQKASLTDASWSNLALDVVATGPVALTTDTLSTAGQRFYRVLVP